VIEGRATYERILGTVCDGEHEEAIRQIQNFLKVYPEFAQAHNDLAVIFHKSGNTLKSLAHHERAHKLDPRNIMFRKNLADFYAAELDWTDEASQIYLDILKDNPFDVETLNALGSLAEKGGRKEQARQFFTRALQLDPLSTDARQALQTIGALPFQETARAVAEEAPTAALKPAPAPEPSLSAEDLYRQAMSAANAGQTAEATRILEDLVSKYPSYALGHNDLGVLYQPTDLQLSRRHHEEAVRLAPSNATFRKNLAEVLTVGFSEHEEALEIYVDLLRSDPRDIEVLKALTFICIETGKTDDARIFLERILSIEPWNAEARETLRAIEEAAQKDASRQQAPEELHAEAVRLSNEGRTEEARAILERLAESACATAAACNDLGVLRYQEGDLHGARSAYEQAVELEPDNALFGKNLADLYFAELGMTDEAIGIYLDLHRRNPRDVETLQGLGVICSAVGRPEEAKLFYRRALEIEPWKHEIREALGQL
jgi:Flp pilus assembly protein TadD